MTHPQEWQIRRGTALIVDVVNFHGQEPRNLADTAAMLDDLYDTISHLIADYQGEVVKWLGDGALTCFWGADHEMQAVKAALALQDTFAEFGERQGFEESGLTIAIATGEMISGAFGSGDTRHYDVFGEAVNCTATIMPGASGAITLCAATYRAISGTYKAAPLIEHPYYGQLYTLHH